MPDKHEVGGSSPPIPTIKKNKKDLLLQSFQELQIIVFGPIGVNCREEKQDSQLVKLLYSL